MTKAEINELIESHMYLAKRLAIIASKRYPRHVRIDDLISDANTGLIYAAKKFDPNRGVKFKTFASKFIFGGIASGVSSRSQARKRKRNGIELFVSLNGDVDAASRETLAAHMPDPKSGDGINAVDVADMAKRINRVLGPNRRLASAYLQGKATLAQLARQSGLSKGTVAKRIHESVARARVHFKINTNTPPLCTI
jgi:RNA polymerase sigma factor (sigma-70 family)